MKIRIGTDIRLNVLLKFSDENYATIQNMRAFLINTTLQKELEKDYIKKNRFIGRFPIEPFVDEFQPTAYNINCSGNSRYKVFVHNEYKGFGLHPDWENCLPVKGVNVTKYAAPVQYTLDPKVVVVTFPADAQLYPGEYRLVVVAQIYAPGYNNMSKTVTVNYNNIFELVNDSNDADQDSVQIEVGDRSDTDLLQDVYSVSGKYDNGVIQVARNDNRSFDIDVTQITGWHEGN